MINLNWFKRDGLLFIPVTWPGWVILAGALAYSIYVFIDIDSRSHSVSDTMINFVFILIIIGAVYSLIGFLTLDKDRSANM